jgi:hypothetical protein
MVERPQQAEYQALWLEETVCRRLAEENNFLQLGGR